MKEVLYIVEGADWITDDIGRNIVGNLKNFSGSVSTKIPNGITNTIVHLGAFPLFFAGDKKRPGHLAITELDRSNKLVLTIFHLVPDNGEKVKILLQHLPQIDLIHTSCQNTKKQLAACGIPAEKIKVIPLGVNLHKFSPITAEEKDALRAKFKIQEKYFTVGSFQKDGNGWEEGNEPKLIKGPDIFCAVMEKLSKKYPVIAILTGPARGYVKKRLHKAGIPFIHDYLKNYDEITNYIRLSDLCLITSRIEGGPRAILEAWATGVPVVSTPVGMIPDIATNNQNILFGETANVEQLAEQAERILTNPALALQLGEAGLQEVTCYSLEHIAKRYEKELYKPLRKLKEACHHAPKGCIKSTGG